jgi:hypothetical protein
VADTTARTVDTRVEGVVIATSDFSDTVDAHHRRRRHRPCRLQEVRPRAIPQCIHNRRRLRQQQQQLRLYLCVHRLQNGNRKSATLKTMLMCMDGLRVKAAVGIIATGRAAVLRSRAILRRLEPMTRMTACPEYNDITDEHGRGHDRQNRRAIVFAGTEHLKTPRCQSRSTDIRAAQPVSK